MNSIIPILKIVIGMLRNERPDIVRILKNVEIAHNGSIHLQNVVEDALDLARLENKKFEIFKEPFEIRKALNDVHDIMKFQID